MGTPDAFVERWNAPLSEQASVTFALAQNPQPQSTYGDTANAFVEAQGLKPIGFNWELLDPYAAPGEPRSALGTMAEAMAHHMEYPSREWLGEAAALQCAQDFVDLFDAADRTILTNRFGDLWNPLTDARIEWGFVGFDTRHAGLLVLTI